MGSASATLLLPARSRLGARALPEALGRWLGRGDYASMRGSAVERLFDVLPRGWPVAAVTRERDARDAGASLWLRADPAWVRPDINGARLLAHGDALRLTQDEADALLAPLKPLFGDTGFLIDAPVPSRWYVQLPAGARLPRFTTPADALGSDLFEHLPDDVDRGSADARRWRGLLSEAQILLHNHPLNARRAAEGRSPVNSLWFWGAGVLPDHVRSTFDAIHTADEVLHAFGGRAKVQVVALPSKWEDDDAGTRAYDLRHVRDPVRLVEEWLLPATTSLGSGSVDSLVLDFGDSERWTLQRSHRWRVWRRPLRTLAVEPRTDESSPA